MRWLITGGSGLLGQNLAGFLKDQDEEVHVLVFTNDVEIDNIAVHRMDIFDPCLKGLINKINPECIVNCIGLTNVDKCEEDVKTAEKLNVEAVGILRDITSKLNAKFVHISTDQVFDGTKSMLDEDHVVCPINNYGVTKVRGEKEALKYSRSLVLRTNFFGKGSSWRKSFSDWIYEQISKGEKINLFTDVYYTPIAMKYLSNAIEKAVRADIVGIYNAVGSERISKHDFGVRLCEKFGLDKLKIIASKLKDVSLKAARPLDMSLTCKKIESALDIKMPSIKESLEILCK